jgi:Ca2+-binding RTX toxin-like protein
MGNEFRVNTLTDGWQRSPDITAFADGSYLIVWDSYFQGNNFTSYYVAGQRYDANGAAVGGQFQIDGFQNVALRNARVTTLSDGGYAVTFTYSTPTVLDPTSVVMRVFNADGTSRVALTQVDLIPNYESRDPEVVSLSNGGFIVFYTADFNNNGTNFEEIYGQIYNAAGAAVGVGFLVNTNVQQYNQLIPEAVTLANGNVMVVWHSEGSLPTGGALNSNEIRGTLFSSTGAVLRSDFSIADAFGVVGDSARDFSIGALRDGGFVVTCYEVVLGTGGAQTRFNIVMQLFNTAGDPVSPRYTVVSETSIPENSAITQLETGEILVTWDVPVNPLSTYSEDVRGRLYDTNGNPLGDAFDIAQDRFDTQEKPRIVVLAGGGFVVTYESESIDPSDDGIAARVFGRATTGNDIAYVDVSGYISGLAGDDLLYGNAQSNTLYGDAGNDALVGGLGADRLYGGADIDVLLMDDYANPNAGGGSDFGYGGGGNDLLWGYAGNDILYGGTDNDTLVGNDFNAGPTGFDQMFGDGGDDNLYLGLNGTAYLDGGTGNDTLFGYTGSDTLRGGLGNDYMYGNLGADFFQFYRTDLASGNTDIVYFVDAGDRLQFSASLNGSLFFQDLASLEYAPGLFTTGVYITAFLGGGLTSTITVYGTTVASLTPLVEYTL